MAVLKQFSVQCEPDARSSNEQIFGFAWHIFLVFK